MTYSDKLKHPEWFKLRRKVWEREDDTCQLCGDKESEMHVHHLSYVWGKEPHDYPLDNFQLLCKTCHFIVEDLKSFSIVKKVLTRNKNGHISKMAFIIDKKTNTNGVTIYMPNVGGGFNPVATLSIECVDFLYGEMGKVFKNINHFI